MIPDTLIVGVASVRSWELVALLLLAGTIVALIVVLLRRPSAARSSVAPLTDDSTRRLNEEVERLRLEEGFETDFESDEEPVLCSNCGHENSGQPVFCEQCGCSFQIAQMRQQLRWDRGNIELSVGRRQDAHIELFDPTASRWHAVVRFSRGSLLVEDLGTVNRTRIDGRALQGPTLLCPGDSIQFGRDVRTYDFIVSCLATEIRLRSQQ